MPFSERNIRRLDTLHSRSALFLGSILVLGALLVGTSVISWQSRQQEWEIDSAYARTAEFLDAAHDVELATLQMIRGERGYLLTGRDDYLEPYTEGRTDIDDALQRLRALDRNDHGTLSNVATLDRKAQTYIELLDRVVGLARSGRRSEALAIVDSTHERRAIEDMRATLLAMTQVEQRDLESLRTGWRDKLASQRVFFYLVSAVGLFLLILASITAFTLRRMAARERVYRAELRILAQTDELTGLANRRETLSSLKRTLADAERTGRGVAFALLDIDHFKRVNDTYGHPVGDEVIRILADKAMASVRGGDLVGRIGGEEFAIVLPGADVAQAYAVCERLRERVHSTAIALEDGTELHITVSVGIARRFDGDSVESIIERADAALYQAKHGGRDQVRLAA